MTDSKQRRSPLGAILLILALVFLVSPFGSNLTREAFLSFKNGNIVGQAAPEPLDGVSIAAYAPAPEGLDEAQEGFVLWTFFSPT